MFISVTQQYAPKVMHYEGDVGSSSSLIDDQP